MLLSFDVIVRVRGKPERLLLLLPKEGLLTTLVFVGRPGVRPTAIGSIVEGALYSWSSPSTAWARSIATPGVLSFRIFFID